MKATLTKIGNSKGIIIPMNLLKQCGFEDEISMEIKEDSLILSKIKKPRDSWKDQFIQAGPEENTMLMDDFSNDEWTW